MARVSLGGMMESAAEYPIEGLSVKVITFKKAFPNDLLKGWEYVIPIILRSSTFPA